MTDRATAAAHIKDLLQQAGIAVDDLLALPDGPAQPAIVAPAPAPVIPAPNAPPAAVADGGHPGFADEGSFYDWLRSNNMLGPNISKGEFDGCDTLTRAMASVKWPIGWVAYGLATPYHETAHTMLPINEMGGDAYFTRLYDVTGQNPARARQYGNVRPGDGPRYHGRGDVQLTWYSNYDRAGQELGIDLVGNPELALDPVVAARILVRGMAEGWFSGKKLSDYLPTAGPGSIAQFTEARRIINGQDRACDIADYAINFQAALVAGKWRF